MGVAGRTAPGSGMEHTVSHLLEMADPASEALHGAKVGVLSVLAALLWGRVRAAVAAGALDGLRFPEPAVMEGRVRDAFAAADPERGDGRGVLARLRPQARALERRADDLRASAPLGGVRRRGRRAARAARAARRTRCAARAPRCASPSSGSTPTSRAGRSRSCHLMRDRFTVADLAFLLGLWEDGPTSTTLLREAADLGVGL